MPSSRLEDLAPAIGRFLTEPPEPPAPRADGGPGLGRAVSRATGRRCGPPSCPTTDCQLVSVAVHDEWLPAHGACTAPTPDLRVAWECDVSPATWSSMPRGPVLLRAAPWADHSRHGRGHRAPPGRRDLRAGACHTCRGPSGRRSDGRAGQRLQRGRTQGLTEAFRRRRPAPAPVATARPPSSRCRQRRTSWARTPR